VSFATNEVAALVTAATPGVKMEIEVAGGGRRQTYQRAAALSADIIASSSPTPVANATSFNLQSPDNGVWSVSIDNDGVLTATKQ
jgi:hypothetical protein